MLSILEQQYSTNCSIFQIMKASLYRKFIQRHQVEQINPDIQTLTSLLDDKLQYINRSFEHNVRIQEIYLDLIKGRKSIHSRELKYYYLLFTDSKAESLMFQHHNINEKKWESNNSNRELLYSLKRLYCRLIEKVMIKISYYLMNKRHLNFIFNSTNELIKKSQILMRRLNFLKELVNVNEVVQKIYKENQIIQEQIIDELINKGYINSVDEFYRINGVDIVQKEMYERNRRDEKYSSSSSEAQVPVEVEQYLKKYQGNIINRGSSILSLRNSANNGKKVETNRLAHRAGIMQMEVKFKNLLVDLEDLISSSQVDQIQEVKEKQENDDINEQPGDENDFQQQISEVRLQNPYQQLNQLDQRNQSKQIQSQVQPATPIIRDNIYNSKKRQRQAVTQIVAKKPKLFSPISTSFNGSELNDHQRAKAIHSVSSERSSVNNINKIVKREQVNKKNTSPFFSPSFLNALRSIEKQNFTDPANEMSIKRMSEHIISYSKKQEQSNYTINQRSPTKHKTDIGRKVTEKNSIVNLLNIYKNRAINEFVDSIEKQYIEDKEGIFCINDHFLKKVIFSKSKRVIENGTINVIGWKKEDQVKRNDMERTDYPFNASKTEISTYKQQKRQFSNLGHLKRVLNETKKSHQSLKDNIKINKSSTPDIAFFLSNYMFLQSKIKALTKTPIFSSSRLNTKYSNSSSQPNKAEILSSVKINHQKRILDQTSILTVNGIENIDKPRLFIKKRQNIITKQASISSVPSIFPNFKIYDRLRRVVIR